MDKLKVNDSVYSTYTDRRIKREVYVFSTVTRLTNKRAILSDDKHLINEPQLIDNVVAFPEYGDSWTKWRIVTPEIIELYKKEIEQ